MATTYQDKAPGVYIVEDNSGPRPIAGVGTACAAFIGFAPNGPANEPRLVTNWTQYLETFGARNDNGQYDPHLENAYLSYAVEGYFTNGGSKCYVTRVVPSVKGADKKPPTKQIPSRAGAGATPAFSMQAKAHPLSDIVIEIGPPTGEAPAEGSFTMKVSTAGSDPETYNLTMGSNARETRKMTQDVTASKLVEILIEDKVAGTVLERMPVAGTYILAANVSEPGKLPAAGVKDFQGDVIERSGIAGLEIGEDITMVCCPDLMAGYKAGLIDDSGLQMVQRAMIDLCERMQDRMAILDAPPGKKPQEMLKWRDDSKFDSMFAALYYPWIKVTGKDGKELEVPPCGHIAGLYARSDDERGVHKAPANEVVRGTTDIEMRITAAEQGLLNQKGVNCIRTFVGRGIRVWGARTLSSDTAWRYINVRRLFNYVEKSIERGTQWVVFEPNDADLWARVRRDVSAFLTSVWRSGALFGATPQQAFFVKCDEELNPPEKRDIGELYIRVGMAPVKPAEFVIFTFSQFVGGGQ